MDKKYITTVESYPVRTVMKGFFTQIEPDFTVMARSIMQAVVAATKPDGPLCLICPKELTAEDIADGAVIRVKSVGRKNSMAPYMQNGFINLVCPTCAVLPDNFDRVVTKLREDVFDDPGIEIIIPHPPSKVAH